MIATEGAAGYDAGQWFPTASTGKRGSLSRSTGKRRPATVTVTPVQEAEAAVSHTFAGGSTGAFSTTTNARYLYYGNDILVPFEDKGGGWYELTVDFSSSWGFLIRTSATQWDKKTKYGAQNSSSATVAYGKPFTLYTHDNPDNVLNVQLPGATMFHSHFWTNWFADLNFGAVETAEHSPAFIALTEDAKGWIDAGVAGFRLDAVKHIYHNENSDENPRFLKKFYDHLNAYYRQRHTEDIYMVGRYSPITGRWHLITPDCRHSLKFSFWYRLQWPWTSRPAVTAKDILEFEKAYKPVRAKPSGPQTLQPR